MESLRFLIPLLSVEQSAISRRRNWRHIRLILACLAGLLINAFIFRPGWGYDPNRDFLGLYAGGKLAGSAQLYNAPAVLAVQRQAVGITNAQRLFVRPPFYAVLLWPLACLPYRAAFLVFQAIMLAATLAFIWLWRIPSRTAATLACCWSMPLMGSFAIGQDIPLLLAVLAGSYLLLVRGRDFHAGMLFSLCAIKPHLFLPLPIFILAQKRWSFGAGVASGGAVLLALSFLGAGPHWLPLFLNAATQTTTNPGAELMPNLKAFFVHTPGFELLSACALAALLWFLAHRNDLAWSFAAFLAIGLLTSHHAYVDDCAILLPALLIVFEQSITDWQRLLVLCLFTPFAYIWLFLADGTITRVCLVLFAASFVIAPRFARYSRSEDHPWQIVL